MLISTVWYHTQRSTAALPNIERKFFVFTSSYLTHSSLFFQKCYDLFINKMKTLRPPWDTEIILSDGSTQQFKNKNELYWASNQSQSRGNSFILFSPITS